MKKYSFLIFALLSSIYACKKAEQTSEVKVVRKEKISGFVQKGPFISGTTILMNELNEKLSQTGKIFTSAISNDLGFFEIKNIELNSSFVEFTASGFYFNEVEGAISNSQLTLTSLSDITDKSSININVLTYLEKKRVETLIKEGKTFSESKAQSRKELLSIFKISLNTSSSFEDFDISKNNEEGAILLAISVILQENRTVGQVTELLAKIQNDIAADGTLDDVVIVKSLRFGTVNLDLPKIRTNVENRQKELNVSSTVPDFEKYVRAFSELKSLNITVEGSGAVNPSGGQFPNGLIVDLTPVPSAGWIFDSWSGDLSGNELSKQITMDQDKTIVVAFKRKNFPINITIDGEGVVTKKIISTPTDGVTSSTGEYPYGTIIELTPTPTSGWIFDAWGGFLEGNIVPKTITVDTTKNISVVFRKPVFRIASNGVTCICENVKPGEKGIANGILYEAVDNQLIRVRASQSADMTKLCTSLVTDMSLLFLNKPFNQPIGNWDVSHVTAMDQLFYQSNFNQDISNWNVSNVTNMLLMFGGTPFNKDISKWNVSSVRSMHRMFESTPFNQPLGNWNVSNVTDMHQMFIGSPFNQPIGNWNVTNVLYMSDMFRGTPFNQPIGNWDVSNVTLMGQMFYESNFNQDISNWKVGNVTDMTLLFGATPFNKDISQWNVAKVRSMHRMFEGTPFNQSIGNWNVSNVTDMHQMFNGTPFNQPIGNWNVSNVRYMTSMFANSSFNQNISTWCVQNITTEPQSFSVGAPLTAENKPKWGTCPQ